MPIDSPDDPDAPAARPAKSDPAENVVVYYKSDGYTMAGERLMGRQSAGASFLAGLARHGRSRDMVCMAPNRASAEEFAETTRKAALDGSRPLHSARWVSVDTPERLAETGCLFYPSPTIADQAWLRRAYDQRGWSLCGITHTTASDTVMEAIGSLATAPLQPWDAVICTSQAVRDTLAGVLDEWGDYLESRLGALAGTGRNAAGLQLPVIPLGIDTVAFDPDPAARAAFRAAHDIADDAVAALFLGRLSATAKAHPLPMFLGLQAAHEKTGRKVHLILAGWFETDAERHQIEYLARDACPDIPVHIVDGRDADARRQAWSGADLFTSLSDNIQETFGLTPIEAMASGLPVVVTDWNGYRDTIEDGVQGIAIPTISAAPGDGLDIVSRYRSGRFSYGGYIARTAQFTAVDIDAATAAYMRLIDDPDLRRKMGNDGRARARSVYDWSVIIPAYEALWTDLADRRRHDPEVAAPVSGRATDPLRDDPYKVFAGYPSAALRDGTRVTRRAPDGDLEALVRHTINSAGVGLMLSGPDLRSLLGAIPDGEGTEGIDVGTLIAAARTPARATRRSILWLAKLGIVRLTPV
ncbi:MAG: glycosyltransferase family 4 protein [Alphaproteobacteria bacterium]